MGCTSSFNPEEHQNINVCKPLSSNHSEDLKTNARSSSTLVEICLVKITAPQNHRTLWKIRTSMLAAPPHHPTMLEDLNININSSSNPGEDLNSKDNSPSESFNHDEDQNINISNPTSSNHDEDLNINVISSSNPGEDLNINVISSSNPGE